MWMRPAKARNEDSSSPWLPFLAAARRVLLLGGFVVAGFAVANWLSDAVANADCGDRGLVSAADVIAAPVELARVPVTLPAVGGLATQLPAQLGPRVVATNDALSTTLEQDCGTISDAVPPPVSDVVSAFGGDVPSTVDAGQQLGELTGQFFAPSAPSTGHSLAIAPARQVSAAGSPVSIVDDRLRATKPVLAVPGLSALRPTGSIAGTAGEQAAHGTPRPESPVDNRPNDSPPAAMLTSGPGTTSSPSGGGGGLVMGAVLPHSVAPDWPAASPAVALDEVPPVRQIADDPAVSPD
jgi:hypothetical protein